MEWFEGIRPGKEPRTQCKLKEDGSVGRYACTLDLLHPNRFNVDMESNLHNR